MVDPFEFLSSPSVSRTNQTKKKTIRVVSTKEKSNDRQRSRSRSKDANKKMNEKENVNAGFTQLIQTKMIESRTRKVKETGELLKKIDNHSKAPKQKRKRTEPVRQEQRNFDQESTKTAAKSSKNVLSSITSDDDFIPTKETTSIDQKLVCQNRCESKDHPVQANNKRRRPCLCSKKQLDELEFAQNSLPSQHNNPLMEQQVLLEEPCLAPNVSFVNHLTGLQTINSVNNDDKEKNEDQLPSSSIVAAPLVLSPTMPTNASYNSRQSITNMTPLPTNLLTFSTSNTSLMVRGEQLSRFLPARLDQTQNLQKQTLNRSSLLSHIPSDRKLSVSTQTEFHDLSIHHPCSDVSECPCVQIYSRSEQLFMSNMAVLFRSSIHVSNSSERSMFQEKRQKNSNRRKKMKTTSEKEIHHDLVSDKFHDEASTIQQDHTIIPVKESNVDHITTSAINIDASVPVNEIHDNSKFQFIVVAMTALKDDQKIVFNEFIEFFSIRSTSTIDETTTHLITDEDGFHSLICPLTGKVLQAVARHLTIVSYRWLKACLTAKVYIDEIPEFEIIGDSIYDQHHGMSKSRMYRTNTSDLLSNYAFHFKCHGCQPFTDNRPLIELINLSGGITLKTLNPHIGTIGRQILILCPKMYLQNKSALEQACQKFNIYCVEPEWLIATIIKYEIQPFQPWLCNKSIENVI